MKIITLNIWSGRMQEPLISFFKKYSNVDIFLLQEVAHNSTEITDWDNLFGREIFKEISEILKDHQAFYAPSISEEWGLAAFVKKSLTVTETGDIFVHKTKDSYTGRDGTSIGRNLQYLKFSDPNKELTAINFHGLWNGKGKSDTVDRINQSKRIVDFIKNIKGELVLCGDFNLLPDTESLKMIEKELGLINLITTHSVKSTRTSFYTKPEKFADYIFVSSGIKVKDFKVLPEEVSDHAALYLEF